MSLKIPPPAPAVLPDTVELETVRVPYKLWIPPPEPPEAVLPDTVELETVRVP